ncbi:MAG: sigma-54 dependent transcriptional regulator [Opitutales bacterium]
MNLLIIDDEQNVLATTAMTVDTAGHKAFTAANTRQADRILAEEDIHAILLDRMLGKEDGLEYLERLNSEGNRRPIIIFTAYSSIESAVDSMRKGAFTYIQKPFVPEQIRHTLGVLEDKIKSMRKIDQLEEQVTQQEPSILLESEEPVLTEAYRIALKAARSDASILLLGPSGTGKSVLARRIHEASDRSEYPFVEISCPSLSKELLESELFGHAKGAFTGAVKETWGKVHAADHGTVFLDEIGELPLEIQPKLLRLLQEWTYERVAETRPRKANVRMITATNRDLKEEVAAGRFREDLYYRLKVISVELPPLVQRQADLRNLAENFLSFYAAKMKRPKLRFSREALQAIQSYDWPGNLREMRNLIERAVILSEGETITAADLSLHPQPSAHDVALGQAVPLDQIEEAHIRRVLEQCDGYSHAAEILDIDTATLYRKRKSYGLL